MMLSTRIQQTYLSSRQYLLFAGYISLVAAAFLCPLTITGTNISIVSASALSVISGEFFTHFKSVRTNPITLSILILVIFVFVTMFWSIAPWHERLGALHKYQKLLYFIFLVPLCLEARWRERAITAFLLAITLTVILSYFKEYAGLTFGQPQNSAFVFHSRIETSYFIAFSIYLLINRALYGLRYRWLYWLLAIVFTYQEFFINTGRTGWVVYFGLVLLFFIQRSVSSLHNRSQKSRNLKIVFRGMVLGTVAVLLLAIGAYNLSTMFHHAVTSLSNYLLYSHSQPANTTPDYLPQIRIPFFEFALKLSKEHPIMGTGTAGFQEAYKRSPGIPGWGKTLNNPHNEYLLILAQGGLVGLATLLYFFYTQWLVSFSLREVQSIAQALVLSFMIGCCFNTLLYTTVTGHFYVIFSSLLFAGYQTPEQKTKRMRIFQ